MKKIIYSLLIISAIAFASCNITRVACVGDSITEGAGMVAQSKTAYPVILNTILGKKYEVLNNGRSGATMLKKGNLPYWNCKEFSNTFVYKPDIIVIKLGTNDTKPNNWRPDDYEKDYQAMIDTFKTISSHPKIYLCLPVPVFATKWGINDSTVVNGVIPTIEKLALKNNLPVINLYEGMKNQGANFPDNIHPNETGAKEMAKIVAGQLTK